MNTIKEIQNINDQELERGLAGTPGSWHAQYAKSAWVYVGNLDHSLTEGDIICVLSQFGEVEDLNLAREEDTGKSRGFAFCKYEDARSCALAVDNFCGIELCGRSMRVDHVENYRLPKHLMEKEEGVIDAAKQGPGHAYSGKELANEYSLEQGHDLFAPPPPAASASAKEKGKSTRKSDDGGGKEEKQKRKEERQTIRAEKEERRRKREQKRTKKGERKREKRARKMRESDDESSDNDRRSKKRSRRDSRSDSRSSE